MVLDVWELGSTRRGGGGGGEEERRRGGEEEEERRRRGGRGEDEDKAGSKACQVHWRDTRASCSDVIFSVLQQ